VDECKPLIAGMFAMVSPVCRGMVGALMFGDSPLSHTVAGSLLMYSMFIFYNNLVFTSSLSW